MAIQPVERDRMSRWPGSADEGLAGWEVRLLELASRGQPAQAAVAPAAEGSGATELDDAYDRCEAITRENSATFTWASQLLPGPQRRAVRALYAFCRISDDIVDEGSVVVESGHDEGNAAQQLEDWRRACLGEFSINHPVALAWADARERFQVPDVYSHQLIDGVARDLEPVSYETFDDLSAYCYGVASTVGLMAMHIIGYQGPEATAYAVRLGVALQMTNILRDVGEDLKHGRLYLPREELAAFGLTVDDVVAGRVDGRWRRFMTFQIQRNRQLYADSLPGIGLLAPAGRFAIGAAAELYAGILDDIEAHGGDVFRRRAHVSNHEKLRRLPGIWWRSRVSGYASPKPQSTLT